MPREPDTKRVGQDVGVEIPGPDLARSVDVSAARRWLLEHRADLLAEIGDYVRHETPSDSNSRPYS